MPTKPHSSEQIKSKLQEVEVNFNLEITFLLICKKLGMHQQTYYQWHRKHGGLRMSQANRLKELEKENTRFKNLLVESKLDKAILR